MGCTRDNYNYTTRKPTTCPSGYNTNHDDCCEYGVYIMWNVLLWGGLCLCFTLCIGLTALRQRKA